MSLFSLMLENTLFSRLGSLFALIIALIAVVSNFDWRLAFWIGAAIAMIGVLARTRLRETPEFTNYKHRMKLKSALNQDIEKSDQSSLLQQEKISPKTMLSYLIVSIPYTIWSYISYIYFSLMLRNAFKFTTEQVIIHNLKVVFIAFLGQLIVSYLAHKFHPLKITRYRIIITFVFLIFLPYYLDNISSAFEVMLCQMFLVSIAPASSGYLDALCYRYFPVSKRFTVVAFTFGIAHSLGYVAIAFGLIYCIKYFGNYGFIIYIAPVLCMYAVAINYLKKLEIKRGAYYKYPEEAFTDDTAMKEEEYNYDDLGGEYEPFKGSSVYSVALMDKIHGLNKEARRKVNTKLIEKAIVFARKWHDGQMRKTGEPFYTHPLAVASMTAEHLFKTDGVSCCNIA